MTAAGLKADRDAETALFELAAATDPGDFRQLLQKASLYANGATLTAEDVAAIAPASTEQGVDEVIGSLGDGNVRAIGPELHRLAAQGVAPITLCIAATRHFRQLHAAASDPAGPARAGIVWCAKRGIGAWTSWRRRLAPSMIPTLRCDPLPITQPWR